MTVDPRRTSAHYDRVAEFMMKAGQVSTPPALAYPVIPDASTRVLRAKLILEEALETITALGVRVQVTAHGMLIPINMCDDEDVTGLLFEQYASADLVEVADGCADIIVVTTGTLLACGITDVGLQEEVDQSNLAKFAPGYYIREDGKLIKPPDWEAPDIRGVLVAQGWLG